MTQGMAAAVGQKAANAGFQRGQLSDYPDVTQDNQQASTSVHYPAGGASAAAALQKTLGHGSLVEDDAVTPGHLLVIAGQDLPKPSALRGPSAGALLQTVADSGSGGEAGAAAPTSGAPTSAATTGVPSTADGTINAAHPGCVN